MPETVAKRLFMAAVALALLGTTGAANCAAGSYEDASGTCFSCKDGTYAQDAGQTICLRHTSCAPGKSITIELKERRNMKQLPPLGQIPLSLLRYLCVCINNSSASIIVLDM